MHIVQSQLLCLFWNFISEVAFSAKHEKTGCTAHSLKTSLVAVAWAWVLFPCNWLCTFFSPQPLRSCGFTTWDHAGDVRSFWTKKLEKCSWRHCRRPMGINQCFPILCLPGTFCWTLWAGCSSRKQEISGEIQKRTPGGDEPGSRDRHRVVHSEETPVINGPSPSPPGLKSCLRGGNCWWCLLLWVSSLRK